jgi:hypothetical protein
VLADSSLYRVCLPMCTPQNLTPQVHPISNECLGQPLLSQQLLAVSDHCVVNDVLSTVCRRFSSTFCIVNQRPRTTLCSHVHHDNTSSIFQPAVLQYHLSTFRLPQWVVSGILLCPKGRAAVCNSGLSATSTSSSCQPLCCSYFQTPCFLLNPFISACPSRSWQIPHIQLSISLS